MDFTRVVVDPEICEGRPRVRETRITVDFILKMLGDGLTVDEIIRDYPELDREDVYEAARYGAWLANERTVAVG